MIVEGRGHEWFTAFKGATTNEMITEKVRKSNKRDSNNKRGM
jgi:hypothetical protein